MAQLPAFQYCTEAELFVDCTVEQRQWLTFAGQPLELSLVLVHIVCCMAIMKFWPLTPKIGKWIPASLIALLVGTLIEWTLFRKAIGQGTRVVEQTAPIAGAPPRFYWPAIPNDSQTISTMLSFAIQLAAIGAVESVLTLQACNEITDTVPKISDSNQECFAQGLANLVCGLFQGKFVGTRSLTLYPFLGCLTLIKLLFFSNGRRCNDRTVNYQYYEWSSSSR